MDVNWRFSVTAIQAVFTAIIATIAVGAGLVVAGVAVLFGTGWALASAGSLTMLTGAGIGVALLREGAP